WDEETFSTFQLLFNHNKFIPTLQRIWDLSPPLLHSRMALHLFHMKLKLLKFNLRALNRTYTKTREAYVVLCDRQNEALWLEVKERNTPFFHQENARNAIKSLLSSSGEVFTDVAINEEAVDNFQRFLQTQPDTSSVSLEEVQELLSYHCSDSKALD
ncbi:hypothetical protein HID58_034581, partial [Brassica napus]